MKAFQPFTGVIHEGDRFTWAPKGHVAYPRTTANIEVTRIVDNGEETWIAAVTISSPRVNNGEECWNELPHFRDMVGDHVPSGDRRGPNTDYPRCYEDRDKQIRRTESNREYFAGWNSEPWRRDGLTIYRGQKPNHVWIAAAITGGEHEDYPIDKANLQRAVDCVNAMQGISDPAAFVRQHRAIEDADEPLTPEWLEQQGFYWEGQWWERSDGHLPSLLSPALRNDRECMDLEWWMNGESIWDRRVRTRGDVMTLLRFFEYGYKRQANSTEVADG